MGARYARAANLAMPGKLGLADRRVLIAIALRVLDAPRGDAAAGLYYGGRYRLLGDMGIMPTTSSVRALRRSIQALIDVELIELVGKPAPGNRSVYELHLPGDNLPR